jgi:hypothetical protein
MVPDIYISTVSYEKPIVLYHRENAFCIVCGDNLVLGESEKDYLKFGDM